VSWGLLGDLLVLPPPHERQHEHQLHAGGNGGGGNSGTSGNSGNSGGGVVVVGGGGGSHGRKLSRGPSLEIDLDLSDSEDFGVPSARRHLSVRKHSGEFDSLDDL
jgi:hypothetical protein